MTGYFLQEVRDFVLKILRNEKFSLKGEEAFCYFYPCDFYFPVKIYHRGPGALSTQCRWWYAEELYPK